MNFESHDAMVAAQKVELKRQAQEVRRLRNEQIESTFAAAVPLKVRLVSLLNEGRRQELHRAELARDSPRTVATHKHFINNGYRNLLADVARRCVVIDAAAPPASHVFTMGTEAIGCFSSMLPWSDGIATAEPQTAVNTTSVPPVANTMSSRPSMLMRKPHTVGAVAAACITASYRDTATPGGTRWNVPARLASDNRKLAAAAAGRRRLLQGMMTHADSSVQNPAARSGRCHGVRNGDAAARTEHLAAPIAA